MSFAGTVSTRFAQAYLTAEARWARRELLRAFAVFGAVVADSGFMVTAAVTASHFRWGVLASSRTGDLLLLTLPAFLLASLTYDAYALNTLRRRGRSVLATNLALLSAAAVAFAAAFALKVGGDISRLETGYLLIAASAYLTCGRLFGAAWLSRLRHVLEPTVFVLGDGLSSHFRSADRVFNARQLNWRPVADDPKFLDSVCRIFRHADRVVLTFDDQKERIAWANFMRQMGISAEIVEPQLADADVFPIGIDRWGDSPTLVVSRGPLSLSERVAKRLLDLTLTLLAAPLVVPLTAILAILVKLDSPGPCLFAQERVGKKNVIFRCYKLRTMRTDVVDQSGGLSASRDDDRVTRIGRWLRKTSLDELPQLWNVFMGEMSLVGPRPHPLGSRADGMLFWNAVDGYWVRHAVKPGVTGLAQVRGLRGATASRQDITERVASDLEYANTWSLWLDIRILLMTPFVMIHRNAF